jgi:hypothetical protein
VEQELQKLGRRVEDATSDEMDSLWERSKAKIDDPYD